MSHLLSTLMPAIHAVLGFAVVGVGAWIAKALSTPTELQRAQHLSIIANDVAAEVVALMPGSTWAAQLEQVIRKLSQASGLPTTNANALARVATSALKANLPAK